MISRSHLDDLSPRDLANYGVARARDLAFDAVKNLWRRRLAAGMKQSDLAKKLGRDPGWVSRALRGPGNWTMRIFGELVTAMDGEIDIAVASLDDPLPRRSNYHAYAEYELPTMGPRKSIRDEVVDAAVDTNVPLHASGSDRVKVPPSMRDVCETAVEVSLGNVGKRLLSASGPSNDFRPNQILAIQQERRAWNSFQSNSQG